AASSELLGFLQAVQAERLPDAAGLDGWLVASLAVFGGKAPAVADRLLRVVAESKHGGQRARCAHGRASLLAALREDQAIEEALIGAGLLAAGGSRAPGFWDDYRNAVLADFRTFRVYGLQVERAVFADLPSLFVPLRLRSVGEGARDRADDDDGRQPADRLFAAVEDQWRGARRTERDSQDLSSVLSAHRRIGLIGGPGCGKTTTLRWLAIVAATAGEEGRETRTRYGLPAEPLVPVFVRFRRLAQRVRERGLAGIAGRAALVAEFLEAEFEMGVGGRHFSKSESLSIAQELLASDGTLLLFDALDEVPEPEMRAVLFDAVADLLGRYPRPRVVLSSRPYAVRREVARLELPLFAPLPLDRAGRQTFARHWYRSVRTHLGAALGPEAAMAQADELAAAAERTPGLAETPLLLSILALVHFNRQGLPVERAVLYDQATLAMLGHWDRDPAGRNLGDDAIPLDWASRLDLREREIRRVVECLALDAQCGERGGDFTEAAAVAALSRGLEAVAAEAEQRAERARLLLRLLAERSGLVQERSPGLFAFAHLNFQEYLAARALVGLGDGALEQLVGLAADGRHAEVIRLAVGVLAADQRAESDRRAVALIEGVGERHAFLAATCLVEAPRLPIGRVAAESLARAALEDSGDRMHHFERAGSIAWLVWPLLERSERVEELLLEFLSCSAGGRRRPHGMEDWPAAILGCHPTGAFSATFEWFLERLAAAAREHSFLGSVARLLLVEAGKLRCEDHVKSLVWVLQWPREISGGLAERAATVLIALAAPGGPVADAVRAELREVVREGYGGAFRAANVWLRMGEAVTADVAKALVEALDWSEHEELCPRLVELARQPESRAVMIAALRRGLRAKDGEVRRGVARILSEIGVEVPMPALEGLGEDDQEGLRNALAALLAEPASGGETVASLGDEIWDEDPKVAWPAAQVLAAAGQAELPGVYQALVRAGLRQAETKAQAVSWLLKLRAQPSHALGVRAALLDGLVHEEAAVAAACAVLLIDCGDAAGQGRLKRIVTAALRDPAQAQDSIPRLRAL
ncbi:MAG TPA: NACHT domain-containing protein, partial [Thermoanaerobaculia bacterium]|nr:NACHT domain-containing protein [Thermoanaerobaculia bacterium]